MAQSQEAKGLFRDISTAPGEKIGNHGVTSGGRDPQGHLSEKEEVQEPGRERFEVRVLPQSNSKKSACKTKYKSVKPKQAPEMAKK